jgi:ATP-binding protein involved in chromosome partitioning
VPFLGGLPLDIRIRENADSGRPTVVADPDGAIAQVYKELRARPRCSSRRSRGFLRRFPSIVIQNT